MFQDPIESKKCCDCGLSIPFAEFRTIHPFLSKFDAKELYENPLMGVYCPNCFIQRPEKPYRKRRYNTTKFIPQFPLNNKFNLYSKK